MAKVMVFTPTWVRPDGQMAMRPETRASVEGQVLPEGLELVWEIGLHNPCFGQSHKNVLAQYVRGRETFLRSDCDALLTFEHDMTMPAGAVQALWQALEGGVGVAYAPYLLRHGSWVLNTWEFIGEHALGESLSLYPEKLAKARAAGIVRVCGCGFGCTMMSREVVERFPFRDGGGSQFSPDIPFAYDALYAGVVSVAVMGVECDHFDGELRLRAFGGAMSDTVEVEATQAVWVLDGRQSRKLEVGERYQLGRTLASDLLRAGYVREVENLAVGAFAGGETGIESREAEIAALEPAERAVAVAVRPKRRKGGSS